MRKRREMKMVVLKACILLSLVLGQATVGWSKPEVPNPLQANAQGTSACSDPCKAVTDASALSKEIALAGKSTGWVQLMPSRYMCLQQTLKGLRKTGIPLVGDTSDGLAPAEHGDDAGLFYFVPWFANSFGLNLDKAIDVFLGGILVIAFLAGTSGLFLFLTNWPSRILALLGMFWVARASFNVGDIYLVQSSVVMALVPWFLYLSRERKLSRGLAVFAFFAGLCAAVSNQIRGQSGTAVLLWGLCIIAFYLNCSRTRKLLLMGVLFAGCLIPTVYFHEVLARRNNFLTHTTLQTIELSGRHVIWSPIYLGFGFLSNELVPAFLDAVAARKVASISPGVPYLSDEYEGILRKEVFSLIRHHPSFVVETLAAKMGVICLRLLVCANVGLLAAALYSKSWPIEVAFWLAIGFNSLFGLLVMPISNYLLGFIAFGTLYALVSIDHALEVRANRQVEEVPGRWLRRTVCAG